MVWPLNLEHHHVALSLTVPWLWFSTGDPPRDVALRSSWHRVRGGFLGGACCRATSALWMMNTWAGAWMEAEMLRHSHSPRVLRQGSRKTGHASVHDRLRQPFIPQTGPAETTKLRGTAGGRRSRFHALALRFDALG